MTPAVSEPGLNPAKAPILYPESDGMPMSDNTKQSRWIDIFFDNLRALFAHRDDVFIAADLLWYPVMDDNDEVQGPDVMVVIGRPKGDRRSYRQWEENDIPVTVAIEIQSPSNTPEKMIAKLLFYEHYGVDEYYVYDPDKNTLEVFLRRRSVLRPFRPVEGFISPLLNIRFEMTSPEMTVYKPDKERFLNFEELQAVRVCEKLRADDEKLRADKAEERLEEERRVKRRLVELSRKARQGQASPEELGELEILEKESS